MKHFDFFFEDKRLARVIPKVTLVEYLDKTCVSTDE